MPGQENKTDGTEAGDALRKPLIHRFAADSSGATAIEYALMAVLLAVPIVTTMTLLRTELISLLSSVADGLSQALTG